MSLNCASIFLTNYNKFLLMFDNDNREKTTENESTIIISNFSCLSPHLNSWWAKRLPHQPWATVSSPISYFTQPIATGHNEHKNYPCQYKTKQYYYRNNDDDNDFFIARRALWIYKRKNKNFTIQKMWEKWNHLQLFSRPPSHSYAFDWEPLWVIWVHLDTVWLIAC